MAPLPIGNRDPAPALPQNDTDQALEVDGSFQNYNGKVAWKSQYVFAPTSLDQISDLMQDEREYLPRSVKIKPGGSRNSYGAGATDGVYIAPAGMDYMYPAAEERALVTKDKHMIRVGSGMTIHELNPKLWAQGLAMPVLGGYDGQTIGGALATGTHGSVLNKGSLNTVVRSIDFVDALGKQYRIEPKGGMTDPKLFRADYPHMTLIQDDDTFNDVQVSVGTMGVIQSYVIETVDKFYLDETRTVTTMTDVARVLANGGIYRRSQVDSIPSWVGPDNGLRFAGHPDQAFHTEILFNPHSDKAVVTTRQKVQLDKEPVGGLAKRQSADLFGAVSLGDRYTRPIFSTWLEEVFHAVLGWVLDLIAKIFPSTIPSLSDSALDSLKDAHFTQRAYNVFDIGDGQNKIPTQSSEFFIPLKGDKHLRAVQVLKQAAAAWAYAHGQYQTGLISMRFVKGSPSALLPNEDYATFEIIFAGHTPYAKDMLAFYQKCLNEEFGNDVKYHWGQLTQLTPQLVEDHYGPGYLRWLKTHHRFDPDNQFVNEAQEKFLVVPGQKVAPIVAARVAPAPPRKPRQMVPTPPPPKARTLEFDSQGRPLLDGPIGPAVGHCF